ncbi:MAG: hypothetical protein MAG551_02425 [Candidatus Scalindua arabica]|uniref:DUF2442 domain-containing protein n=1 Tax=Candidatus Scalindua arabica TaxID=1127984 RepID=A0A941W4L0_9BACT|nr:hypothetical protein [Candidatus Scalindua arabica]
MEYMPVIIDAKYISDYKIKIIFDNGEEKIADFAEWLEGEIFEPLKNKKYFQKFFVDGWSISWPNGADISPETLYEESQTI